jgi:hypothetical protein
VSGRDTQLERRFRASASNCRINAAARWLAASIGDVADRYVAAYLDRHHYYLIHPFGPPEGRLRG